VRLISTRTASGETLGVVDGDRWLPAATLVPGGPSTISDLLLNGSATLDTLRAAAADGAVGRAGRPVDEIVLLAPVPQPGKIVAIGRNYREHVEEEHAEAPPAPLVFAKFPSAVVGDGAEIRWDPGAR